MNGKTHLAISVGLCLYSAESLEVALPVALAIGAIAGLAPDIDHPQSIIRKYIPLGRVLDFFISHRGITHSVWLMAIIALAIGAIVPAWGVLWAIGYGSHLIADMLTPAGVPLLYPVKIRFRVLPPFLLRWLYVPLSLSLLGAGLALSILSTI